MVVWPRVVEVWPGEEDGGGATDGAVARQQLQSTVSATLRLGKGPWATPHWSMATCVHSILSIKIPR